MKHITNRIKLIEQSDINYPYGGKPCFSLIKHDKFDYQRTEYIHNIPCYHHNVDLVKELVCKMDKIFSVKWKPYFYIIPFDTEDRTNGMADKNYIYNDKEKNGEANGFRPNIMLWGKFVPLHPAMTRYLTAHEYGHIVNYWIEYKIGEKENSVMQFDKNYAQLRKIKLNTEYGVNKWHNNIGEIIANDIRICLFGMEEEFWPHPCKHPLACPNIVQFWSEMREKHSYHE